MRNFFVTWMERLLGLMVILSMIGICLAAFTALTSGQPRAMIAALGIVIAGAISVIVTFGFAYIALGIHANTLRTAEATEAMLRGGERRTTAVAPPVEGGVAAPAPSGAPRPRLGPAVGPLTPGNRRR